jgi:hypothetical protein
MVATYAEAIKVPPVDTDGGPIGDGDWRIAVQLLIASGGARVGKSRVGTARVSTYVWYDITHWASIEYTQGSKAVGQGWPRASVGQLTLLLDNEGGRYSPVNIDLGAVVIADPAINTSILHREFTPRALIRLVAFKPGASTVSTPVGNGITDIDYVDWQPLYTGVIEQCEEIEELGRNLVKITAIEALTILAGIQTTAIAAVGANDRLAARLVRLLAGVWPFPITRTDRSASVFWMDSAGYELQATTMATRRLAEVYLTCDSINACEVFPGRDGSLRLHLDDNVTATMILTTSWTLPIIKFSTAPGDPTESFDATHFPAAILANVIGPIRIVNDDRDIINDVTATRVGGTAQRNYTQQSIDVYGRRTKNRSDLISASDLLANYYSDIVRLYHDAINGTTLPGQADLDQTLTADPLVIVDQYEASRSIETGRQAFVDYQPADTGELIRIHGRISHAHHVIQAGVGRVHWTTTSTLERNSFVWKPTL